MDLFELTRKIIAGIPADQRFSQADGELLLQHRELLLSLEEDLVKGFYDNVESNQHMVVLMGGTRGERESTLRRWWQRTLSGPFDDRYWAWQTLVGVVHIKVGVTNPMMMGMWNWMVAWLRTRITPEACGGADNAARIMGAVERLSLATQAIIGESYLQNYLETVIRITGFKPALLERMFKTEINVILSEARAQLGAI